MDYKEKVIALLNSQELSKEQKEKLEGIFPELAESEDERIRKGLINAFEEFLRQNDYDKETNFKGVNTKEALAWLEKQGEQKLVDKIQLGKKYKCIASPRYSTFMIGEIYKPEDKFLCSLMNFCSDCFEPIKDNEQKHAEQNVDNRKLYDIVIEELSKYGGNEVCKAPWALDSTGVQYPLYFAELGVKWQKEQKPAWSEEDDNCLSTIIAEFSKCAGKSVSKDEWMRCNDFLNSLKDRVVPQPKQEWSEEDENMLQSILDEYKSMLTEKRNWLKSLRPQNHWKPSDAQMASITCAVPTSICIKTL